MCGIAGIANFPGKPVSPPSILRMAAAIRHRGPDDEGYVLLNSEDGTNRILGGDDSPAEVMSSGISYTPTRLLGDSPPEGANVALANRRLAILDLSAAGHQPMSNRDGSMWVVHNGEIYNYQEIRAELERLGRSFESRTDTEVVLQAYEEWGADCLHRFNGMWAFAIWDVRRRRLFCSRDRFGIKPFYYQWDGETFLFASEIKALTASGMCKARPYEPSIHDYLAYGRTDHSEDTFYDGVKQLPGGHHLELDLDRRSFKVHRYYDIPLDNKVNGLSMDAYAGQFYELFEDAVRLRLTSDVPVGSCLSGGLDSSSIVCTVSHLARNGRVRLPRDDWRNSYSARHDDQRHDEGHFIEAVIERTGVDAHMVYPTALDLRDQMGRLLWHQDEPFGSTSIYAQWSVFEKVNQTGVKVVLDGQGADESLAGYLTYHREHLASLLRSGRLRTLFREARSHHDIHNEPWFSMIAGAVLYSPPAIIGRPLRTVIRRRQSNWLDRGFTGLYGDTGRHDSVPVKTNAFDHALYRSFHLGLPALLRYEDRNSMAHSVESRLPFLDYRLVEWMFSTPREAKIRNGTTKVVLREAMSGRLPELVRLRQDKMGFGTPEDVWMRTELRDFIVELLHSERFLARPYYNHASVHRSLSDHLEGRRNVSTTIWSWVNLELWLRMIEDGTGAPGGFASNQTLAS